MTGKSIIDVIAAQANRHPTDIGFAAAILVVRTGNHAHAQTDASMHPVKETMKAAGRTRWNRARKAEEKEKRNQG